MRVLLVEDESDLGTAIKWALKQEKYIVDWALDGQAAWDLLESTWTQYTVGIFDWRLPGLSGLELCQRLRERNNPLPVLMLTANDRREDKIAGLDAGADDYLVKPFDMEELLARVRALQRRSPSIRGSILQAGNLVLEYNQRLVFAQIAPDQRREIPLTNKEFQLLEYFLSHPTQTVTGEQLWYQLWEHGSGAASNVVAAHIRSLRRKLAEHGCHDVIETVRLGYRLSANYTA
jgi:DNA-binding response OmpR family regulator